MHYAKLTQRIAGDGAAAWDIHYRALALREQGADILLLSVGDPDFDTPQPIVQAAIGSLLAGGKTLCGVLRSHELTPITDAGALIAPPPAPPEPEAETGEGTLPADAPSTGTGDVTEGSPTDEATDG